MIMEKTEESGVKQVALSGDRMGILIDAGKQYGGGVVMASQGSLKTGFVQLVPSGQFSKSVKKIAMCGKRVVILTEDGQVYGISPDNFGPTLTWNGKWTGLLTDGTIANDIAVSDNRVLVLKKGGQEDGQVFVKEGDWGTSGWVNITNNQGVSFPKMKKIAMSAKRVIALTEQGQLYGTSPDNFGPTWNGIWTGLLIDNILADNIAVTDDRILVATNVYNEASTMVGDTFVKEGGWGAAWTKI